MFTDLWGTHRLWEHGGGSTKAQERDTCLTHPLMILLSTPRVKDTGLTPTVGVAGMTWDDQSVLECQTLFRF